MPFRHIALLTVDPACDVDRLATELQTMAAAMPTIRSYQVGRDAGLSEGNATIAIVADFDDQAAWEAYRVDPEHQRIATEQLQPHLLAKSAVQHLT